MTATPRARAPLSLPAARLRAALGLARPAAALGLALAAAGCRARPEAASDPAPASSHAALTSSAPTSVAPGDPGASSGTAGAASGTPGAASASPPAAAFRARFRLLYRIDDAASWGDSKRAGGADRAHQEWQQRVHAVLPPPYDEAVRSAPWPRYKALLVVGGGGPTLMLGKGKVARWQGDQWTLADAPWPGEVVDATRLADGATLLTAMTDRGAVAHFIGADGAVSPPLTTEDGQPLRALRIARVDDQAFLLVSGAEPGDAHAYGSREPGPTRLAPLLAPGKRRDSITSGLVGDVICPPPAASGAPAARPASSVLALAPASASGGWTAFAAPAASALPCDQPGSDAGRCRKEALGASSPLCLEAPIPLPTGFHAACKAPFVLAVVRPRDLNEWSLANGLDDYSYPLAREALSGHPELAGHVTLLAFQRERRVYFGAQVDTEATARAVMELLQVKKIKPQLGCLDALGHLPDRRSPPRGVFVMDVNFATGELLF